MKLINENIKSKIPALYAQDGKGFEAIVYIKLMSLSGWNWYITEFDGKDTFFGYVCGFENEWGYISLQELESLGNLIERDLYFEPKKLKYCLNN